MDAEPPLLRQSRSGAVASWRGELPDAAVVRRFGETAAARSGCRQAPTTMGARTDKRLVDALSRSRRRRRGDGMLVRPRPATHAGNSACRGAVLVPGREDPRPLAGDRHGEFEMRGQRAVLREDRPTVVAHAHAV